MNIKIIDSKPPQKIAEEWDLISPKRNSLIKKGDDISFSHVLVPNIINYLKEINLNCVVDCGCGCGELTSELARISENIIGIDISNKSVEIAKKSYSNINNLNFINTSINQYSLTNKSKASLCIANMVLSNIIDLREQLKSIYKILNDEGKFLFTIPHPCFWPIYWNYFEESWFEYDKEIIMEVSFLTTLSDVLGVSTYIQRPISFYTKILKEQGFRITIFKELYPLSPILDDRYIYSYPRFLLFLCDK